MRSIIYIISILVFSICINSCTPGEIYTKKDLEEMTYSTFDERVEVVYKNEAIKYSQNIDSGVSTDIFTDEYTMYIYLRRISKDTFIENISLSNKTNFGIVEMDGSKLDGNNESIKVILGFFPQSFGTHKTRLTITTTEGDSWFFQISAVHIDYSTDKLIEVIHDDETISANSILDKGMLNLDTNTEYEMDFDVNWIFDDEYEINITDIFVVNPTDDISLTTKDTMPVAVNNKNNTSFTLTYNSRDKKDIYEHAYDVRIIADNDREYTFKVVFTYDYKYREYTIDDIIEVKYGETTITNGSDINLGTKKMDLEESFEENFTVEWIFENDDYAVNIKDIYIVNNMDDVELITTGPFPKIINSMNDTNFQLKFYSTDKMDTYDYSFNIRILLDNDQSLDFNAVFTYLYKLRSGILIGSANDRIDRLIGIHGNYLYYSLESNKEIYRFRIDGTHNKFDAGEHIGSTDLYIDKYGAIDYDAELIYSLVYSTTDGKRGIYKRGFGDTLHYDTTYTGVDWFVSTDEVRTPPTYIGYSNIFYIRGIYNGWLYYVCTYYDGTEYFTYYYKKSTTNDNPTDMGTLLETFVSNKTGSDFDRIDTTDSSFTIKDNGYVLTKFDSSDESSPYYKAIRLENLNTDEVIFNITKPLSADYIYGNLLLTDNIIVRFFYNGTIRYVDLNNAETIENPVFVGDQHTPSYTNTRTYTKYDDETILFMEHQTSKLYKLNIYTGEYSLFMYEKVDGQVLSHDGVIYYYIRPSSIYQKEIF